jgi:hypothetical protein
MAVYVSAGQRRRRVVLIAVATLAVGLLVGFAVGVTRTTSVDARVHDVQRDANNLATRLVALDIEYRDALDGGADDFDTSVSKPLAAIEADTVRLLDRAPWVSGAGRNEVLDAIANVEQLAQSHTPADPFLTALQQASKQVTTTFGAAATT